MSVRAPRRRIAVIDLFVVLVETDRDIIRNIRNRHPIQLAGLVVI
jgi:hypothetical protein